MAVSYWGKVSVDVGTLSRVQPCEPLRSSAGAALEPHLPVDRLRDGSWVFAPYAAMRSVESGERVVCHVCGDALAAVSAQHVRRHGLTLDGYRERFGLNRKQSLLTPALAETRRSEGHRRWAENAGVRDDLAQGQEMARTGVLHDLGARAQPAGSRRAQGRASASREGRHGRTATAAGSKRGWGGMSVLGRWGSVGSRSTSSGGVLRGRRLTGFGRSSDAGDR